MKKRIFFILILALFIKSLSLAQTKKSQTQKHSPQKATLLSIFPGGGQIYNKKYWKVPIIYAGFAALAYSAYFNNTEYNRFKTAYRQSVKNEPITDPELVNVPQQMLQNTREFYQKNRDLSYIGMAGLYALNLIDAAVDAHLKQFDVSDNLSLKIKPGINYYQGFVASTLQIQIKIH